MDPDPQPPVVPSRFRNRRDGFRYPGAPPLAATSAKLLDGIEVVPRHLSDTSKQESAGWLSSAILHGGLLLMIALIVSPADLGGQGMRTLRFSFSQDVGQMQGPIAILDVVAVETNTEPDPSPPDPQPATKPSDDVAEKVVQQQQPPAVQRSGGALPSDAAHGSFFGIEASGHEFVYVLDMSGSMNGMRFRRAARELVRSVETLDASQKFYVLLFNDSTTQLLGSTSIAPNMMYATRENKNRLGNWLNTMNPRGGTDPRSALHLALRMNPSAIFMLSDGKFSDDKKRSKSMPFATAGDTFDVVNSVVSTSPIHTIAYEDPESCQNMQRLANLTSGDYRFIQQKPVSEQELVAMAKVALAQTSPEIRSSLLVELRTELAKGASDETNSKIAERLAASCLELLAIPRVDDAFELFVQSVQLRDRQAVPLPDQIDAIEKLTQQSMADGNDLTRHRLSRLAKRMIGSPIATRINDAIAETLLVEGQQLENDRKPLLAIDRYLQIVQQYPKSDLAATSRLKSDRFEQQVRETALRLQQQQDVSAAIVFLRGLVSQSKSSAAQPLVATILQELTFQTLVRYRDAGMAHDRVEKNKVLDQLEKGFQDDPLFDELRTQFASQERAARRQFSRLLETQHQTALPQWKAQLQQIVDQFPDSIAAGFAQRHLDAMQPRNHSAGRVMGSGINESVSLP
ncbi:hypothetical protein NHH03_09725 [Stieleria sp. TO1_6]|uniref:hypothetical protein n=1 Tax=Stieleria tagensis TaxID=2956795 RepID=UPI00209BA3C0|nr:hypothetical protein [Stieleria tagensis]MCO8122015.1 hypothetical protein [Stieleria tagensis]